MRCGLHNVIQDITHERVRQKEVKGWTERHDDAQDGGELSAAALGYVQSALSATGRPAAPLTHPPAFWPWSAEWWKPTTPRRDLVKAAALIIAEIERLDRAKGRALMAEIDSRRTVS